MRPGYQPQHANTIVPHPTHTHPVTHTNPTRESFQIETTTRHQPLLVPIAAKKRERRERKDGKKGGEGRRGRKEGKEGGEGRRGRKEGKEGGEGRRGRKKGEEGARYGLSTVEPSFSKWIRSGLMASIFFSCLAIWREKLVVIRIVQPMKKHKYLPSLSCRNISMRIKGSQFREMKRKDGEG
jgi:hypothetical protein